MSKPKEEDPEGPPLLCTTCQSILDRDGIVLGSECPTGVDS